MTKVPRPAAEFSLRSFRDGDEEAVARLFSEYLARFVGPAPVTPDSWLRQYAGDWDARPLAQDGDRVRLAERDGEVIGYAVASYHDALNPGLAAIVELCVAEGEEAEEVGRALVEDVEQRAAARGRHAVALHLPLEDGLVEGLVGARSYHTPEAGPGVFMAVITNLPRFLSEIEDELTGRLTSSEMRGWEGLLCVKSDDLEGALRIREGRVEAAPPAGKATAVVQVHRETLPLLLLGRISVAEAYLQHRLAITGADPLEVLRLLEALFPRLPLFLPRVQWW